MDPTPTDRRLLERAIALALATEASGNLPIGCVVALGDTIVAEGGSTVVHPVYRPGNHAEQVALRAVPDALWPRARELTLCTTLEPCLMCLGSALLHGIGRIVFGASDVLGGGGHVLPHLPPYYADGRGVPTWIGPIDPDRCDPLYHRADLRFAELPAGQRYPAPWREPR